jgi:NAD(P)-dependent dehydrogenase (short-subunit alcohol dehydrogenase family)
VQFPAGFAIAGESNGERYVVDLTNAAAVQQAVDKIGRIDAVLNIAGGFNMGPTVYETSANDWDAMFAINVTTLKNVLAAVVPKMLAQGRGAIVNVGANAALTGQANMSAYCAAKSVVMRLTESLAAEVKNRGINVNAVLPSIIDTPANRAGMPDADFTSWVSPADLASVMCFLASDAARAVHGALLPVKGLL